jgi:hypothetical protein
MPFGGLMTAPSLSVIGIEGLTTELIPRPNKQGAFGATGSRDSFGLKPPLRFHAGAAWKIASAEILCVGNRRIYLVFPAPTPELTIASKSVFLTIRLLPILIDGILPV